MKLTKLSLALSLVVTSNLTVADEWQKLKFSSVSGVTHSVKVDVSIGTNYPDVILKTHYSKPQRIDNKVFTDRFIAIFFNCRDGKMKTYKSIFWNKLTEEKVVTPWSLDFRQPTTPLEIATINKVCDHTDVLGIVE